MHERLTLGMAFSEPQILRALTENANERFRLNFADSQLIERLRTLAGDPVADKQVKRALLSVLLSWKQQFGDSPQHNYIASLYDSVKVRPRFFSCSDDDRESLKGTWLSQHRAAALTRLKHELRGKERKRTSSVDKLGLKRPRGESRSEETASTPTASRSKSARQPRSPAVVDSRGRGLILRR